MKRLIGCAILAILISAAHADPDPRPYVSPDGAFVIVNVGDRAAPDHHFQLRSRDGQVLLSSDAHPPLASGSFATAIRWSPDSRFVAFSVRTSGPYIHDTFVYSTRTDSFLRLPTKDEDYQTMPIRWHNAHTLIVQTSAPFGGKATEESTRSFNQYRRTIRLSESPLRLETLYTSRRVYPNR